MTEKIQISVTMLVKNSAQYLQQVLTALSPFDEVLLLDNGSTDDTLVIAKTFENVRIEHSPFLGFGPLKNRAAELAKHDWILNIDSDEILPAPLIAELAALTLDDPNRVYAILRLNHYRGRVIKTCGWYPDYVKRLYNRTLVHFNDNQVHESLVVPSTGKIVRLQHSFDHFSFAGATDLIQKMQQYSSLFAQQQRYRKHAGVFSAISHGLAAFFKHYVLKKGVLSGRDGFVISAANAMGAYYKYIKLAEANDNLRVSLIITTYNRPDALLAVLNSVLKQTVLPFEVIVADDGSDARTRDAIEQIRPHFTVPLIHSWQPDEGFRAARSRNQALAQATGDYIIVIDGDMLLHSNFVEDHINFAKKGCFVQGYRVLLPQIKTEEILHSPLKSPKLKWYQRGIETRFEKRIAAVHLPILGGFLGKERANKFKGIKTCNMAFFRDDAFAINGFNNEFVGWGREDSEFVARLYNNGVKRRDVRFAAIAYHLWHNEAERDALPANDKRLKRAMNEGITRCENGVEQCKDKL
ncbi:glycosyltransferase family 2 protein [Spirabiliibacterium falconis]|uniref:glycosyltransferase family 2 protein n=1 Tax=Spirabiliibacterium falconis TaxID=572023 RepID=UPI001AACA7EF|nr:glycosyltransferase [Spirabiliibacterium falconis]MBE2894372.1 glycosyltransferase [Spirabiliibacterium falconis]